MRWGEWPLMIFTVVAQSATGAFWWCCLALVLGSLPADQVSQLERLMLVIWAMIALAFSTAAFHLGSPRRCLNAGFRFGQSSFSNEVVFGSAFVGLGFLGWLMSTFTIGSTTVQIIVLGLTVLFSFAFLASMTAFYMMPTVPTWNTPLTPAAFILTTIIGGSTIAATIFAAAGVAHLGLLHYGPVVLVSVALVAAIVVTLLQSALLPKIRSSIKRATDLSPNYAGLMAIRFVILFSALGLWLLDLLGSGTFSVGTGISCAILVMIGEMVGRGVHYGLHMTVGLR